MKTTHQAIVNRVTEILPHPDADALELIVTDNLYTSVVRKGQFNVGDLYVFIVPDSVVDGGRPDFSFLGAGKHRIKVKKLSGVVSQGLVVVAPPGFNEGDDTWDYFGLERYEPELALEGGDAAPGPSFSKYDIDAIHKWVRCYEGKDVVVTEKLNGANARYINIDGEVKIGSRTQWKREGNNAWWNVLTDDMRAFLNDYPDHVLFGEVFGQVGGFKYGLTEPKFAAFDVLQPNRQYMCAERFIDTMNKYGIFLAPILKIGPFDLEWIKEEAEKPSILDEQTIREGVVVKTTIEQVDNRGNRLAHKYVSNQYYLKKGK